jgi:hypothetical protein
MGNATPRALLSMMWRKGIMEVSRSKEETSSTEEYDKNVDEEILDVISHDNFERQQVILSLMAARIPVVTVARRVYSALFPVMESNNRRTG